MHLENVPVVTGHVLTCRVLSDTSRKTQSHFEANISVRAADCCLRCQIERADPTAVMKTDPLLLPDNPRAHEPSGMRCHYRECVAAQRSARDVFSLSGVSACLRPWYPKVRVPACEATRCLFCQASSCFCCRNPSETGFDLRYVIRHVLNPVTALLAAGCAFVCSCLRAIVGSLLPCCCFPSLSSLPHPSFLHVPE